MACAPDKVFIAFSFLQCLADACVFRLMEGGTCDYLIVVHMDDILVIYFDFRAGAEDPQPAGIALQLSQRWLIILPGVRWGTGPERSETQAHTTNVHGTSFTCPNRGKELAKYWDIKCFCDSACRPKTMSGRYKIVRTICVNVMLSM